MFWKFDLHSASQVEKLLEREDVTLKELLEEDDVLQECKAQNQRLLLFLTQDNSLLELISLITHEPPTDREEKLRYKYANVACELLTCDLSVINDKVGGDESLMNTLYSFLEQEPPLNPLLASFFSKTFGNLINCKPEQTVNFLRKKDGFLMLVLKHFGTSAMMDLLLRLISCVEPIQLRQEVLTWLNEEQLVQRLIDLIHPLSDREKQSNASQTLSDIIRMSRDQASLIQYSLETDPLLTTVELQQSVEALLNNMFRGEKNEVCIVNGTMVLLTLLEPRKPGVELIDPDSQESETSSTVTSSILLGIQPYLQHYHHLLLHPLQKCSILTTLGVLKEPFGNARLHACRLMVALLNTHAPKIHHELCQLDMINLLLDLFFKFTWNNFLHVQVEQCVSAILHPAALAGQTQDSPGQDRGHTHTSGEDTREPDHSSMSSHQDLLIHLFQKCRLVQRILDAWEENEKTQADGGMRRGYMGHLTRMANAVVQSLENGPERALITRLIDELPGDYRNCWQKFMDEALTEINKKNAVDLVFSDYQIQQMTANFVDQFGINDEFGEHDDGIRNNVKSLKIQKENELESKLVAENLINATFNRFGGVICNMVDEGPSIGTFQQCHRENIPQFDDDDDDAAAAAADEEDIWEDKEINYATRVKSRTRFGVTSSLLKDQVEGGVGCSASPDLEPKLILNRQKADKDNSLPPSPGWVASFEDDFNFKTDLASVALDSGAGVWGDATVQMNDGEEKTWAAFTDFQPFCCSDSGARCSSPVGFKNPDVQNQDADGESSFCSESVRAESDYVWHIKNPAACVWSVCGARKAPLVASDSSSSGSDSEEEERSDVPQGDTATSDIKLTADDKNDKVHLISSSDGHISAGLTQSSAVQQKAE